MGVEETERKPSGFKSNSRNDAICDGECLTLFATKNCFKKNECENDAVTHSFSPFKHSVLATLALTTTTSTRQHLNTAMNSGRTRRIAHNKCTRLLYQVELGLVRPSALQSHYLSKRLLDLTLDPSTTIQREHVSAVNTIDIEEAEGR